MGCPAPWQHSSDALGHLGGSAVPAGGLGGRPHCPPGPVMQGGGWVAPVASTFEACTVATGLAVAWTNPPQPDQGLRHRLAMPREDAGLHGGAREPPATAAEAPGEEGAGAARLDVSPRLDVSRLRSSSVEIREKGSEFLREELREAQKELRLKDEECARLGQVRAQLERELEELTASLFQEAHRMVREANVKQAASEKQLKEARGKIDMLQAEVTALKTLVITSTPASPNRELHPQLQSPSKATPRKGHSHHTSASGLCPRMCPAATHTVATDRQGREPGAAPLHSLLLCVVPGRAVHLSYEPAWQLLPVAATSATSLSLSRQVDAALFAEFQDWRASPTLDKTCPFLDRVYREDVGPCLDFATQELSALVRAAVEENSLTIEPAASQARPVGKADAGKRDHRAGMCALSGLARTCHHHIRLGDSESRYYISPSSRARITAVCNFFTYIRYIQQGLVRQDAEPMFWEVMRLRKEMSLAKLGFLPQEA
ncbi:LOW QUALITY PROTEIN: guanine nucleotide exchange factor for Rab-3A [Ctenodactylus gundi]